MAMNCGVLNVIYLIIIASITSRRSPTSEFH